MSGDPVWPILFSISLLLNLLLLLRKKIIAVFHRGEHISEDNIRAMVEECEESGCMESTKKTLIENVFEFSTMTAHDVMVHRTDMVALSLEDEHATVVEEIRQSGLSRFPVFQEDMDDIVGVLSTREYLLNACLPNPQPMKQLLRAAYFVPETVAADVLFRDMQSKKIHMAIVIDEYGGTSGLVTLEDLLEELVGNIYDEFDPLEEQDIIQLSEQRWRVSGAADLEDLAQAVGFDLPEDEDREYDTLGGLIFSQMSVIPEDGSHPEVETLGLHIQVETLHERRVEWAMVEKLTQDTASEQEKQ